MKRFLTDANRDCASTATTSAYRSAIKCTLAAFGFDCNLYTYICNSNPIFHVKTDNSEDYYKFSHSQLFLPFIYYSPFFIIEPLEGDIFDILYEVLVAGVEG